MRTGGGACSPVAFWTACSTLAGKLPQVLPWQWDSPNNLHPEGQAQEAAPSLHYQSFQCHELLVFTQCNLRSN